MAKLKNVEWPTQRMPAHALCKFRAIAKKRGISVPNLLSELANREYQIEFYTGRSITEGGNTAATLNAICPHFYMEER